MSDLVKSTGSHRAYYTNLLPDGDRDWGTLEGETTVSGDQITLEGT